MMNTVTENLHQLEVELLERRQSIEDGLAAVRTLLRVFATEPARITCGSSDTPAAPVPMVVTVLDELDRAAPAPETPAKAEPPAMPKPQPAPEPAPARQPRTNRRYSLECRETGDTNLTIDACGKMVGITGAGFTNYFKRAEYGKAWFKVKGMHFRAWVPGRLTEALKEIRQAEGLPPEPVPILAPRLAQKSVDVAGFPVPRAQPGAIAALIGDARPMHSLKSTAPINPLVVGSANRPPMPDRFAPAAMPDELVER